MFKNKLIILTYILQKLKWLIQNPAILYIKNWRLKQYDKNEIKENLRKVFSLLNLRISDAPKYISKRNQAVEDKAIMIWSISISLLYPKEIKSVIQTNDIISSNPPS